MARSLLTLALAALLATPAAAQQDGTEYVAPPGNSALDQYFESVPSSSGNNAPGAPPQGGDANGAPPLDAREVEALAEQGAAGEQVSEFVTANAPRKSQQREEATDRPSGSGSQTAAREPAPAGADTAGNLSRALLGDAGDGMGVLLPLLLGLTALLGIGYVLLRRKTMA